MHTSGRAKYSGATGKDMFHLHFSWFNCETFELSQLLAAACSTIMIIIVVTLIAAALAAAALVDPELSSLFDAGLFSACVSRLGN